MKKIGLAVLALAFMASCKTQKTSSTTSPKETVVSIDLVNVINDKVAVTITPPNFTSETTSFYIPKTVPGTYSTDNYGKYIEGFKALDSNGNELSATKTDDNTWKINNAKQIAKISYLVNDTYDIENTHDVFSPAGTNILKDKNFVLNLHGFVGYFKEFKQVPFKVTINHPANLTANTSLVDTDASNDKDIFVAKRYFELVDNPIMYAEGNSTSFKIGEMDILLSVYSPNNTIKAEALKDNVEKMMAAQKAFMGDIDATKKYSILLYMSSMSDEDAQGFGALEHHTSTTVVLPEMMPMQALAESIKDVVSHEFFHIVTPLSVHSKEIHYFDYNDPKMSEHLWMYEGVTEYFANLFQTNQGLIDDQEFYGRILGKINGSKRYDDNMSFTEMSKNILEDPYKPNYANVYEKGALIGMCIDLIIREESNGEKGILDLMKALTKKYGVEKPFLDAELLDDVTSLTYPEVRTFIDTHVVGNTPIDYSVFFNKLGLAMQSKETKTGYLMKDMQTPYISADQKTKEVFFLTDTNSFLRDLGVKPNDRLVSINGTDYNLTNIQALVMGSFSWQPGNDITMVVKRQGEEITLKGKITEPMGVEKTLAPVEGLTDSDKRVQLRKAWMKG
ncbi:M61 family metallopeptidase [Pseudofulvibacter geojedonensis]|uniref:Peptidase M61 n=1 Tax=Pseudofulvibacter geojedonensis TaxID=1123758 RepID=A0ABW3I096_9FLAO